MRRLVLALSIIPPMLVLVPQSSSAALSLALPPTDYPQGAKIVPQPATNIEADTLLGPVHRSSFERLRRRDGQGWLQAALWHFETGSGAAVQTHQTIWGYGINVFKNHAQANRAISDVKIPTKRYRVAHLSALLYESTDVRETLVFVFFTFHNIEVENYYEYLGVAPTGLAKSLRHLFSTQSSHLARYARALRSAMHQQPTPAPTDTPTVPPTAILTPTVTPTGTSRPTSTPRPTPTRAPTPTPTPTPTGFQAQATMTQPSYPPWSSAVVKVVVTLNGQPVAGAQVVATFYFGKSTTTCTSVTDAMGTTTCMAQVPDIRNGTTVVVQVQVAGPNGESAMTSASFTVQGSG